MQTPNETTPGDWRKGGYRDGYQQVPPPPRKPGPFAKELIHHYQGSQKLLRNIGLILIATCILPHRILAQGIATDVALDLWAEPSLATVTTTRLLHNGKMAATSPTEIIYRYQINGITYGASSYTDDSKFLQFMVPETEVPIEILSSAPSWSRIQTTRSAPTPFVGMLFLAIPLLGAISLLAAYRSNRNKIRPFRDGIVTKGRIVKRGEYTAFAVKGYPVFEIVWEFQIDGTNYKGKLSHMDASIINRAFPDDEVTVLYDPRNPKINTVWVEG